MPSAATDILVPGRSRDERSWLERVTEASGAVRIQDVHTHLYDPAFGEMLLWGVDELLTYHYLIAEVLRYFPGRYTDFWALTKAEQADLIFSELFLKRSPISEACRGVVSTLHALGLGDDQRDLRKIRAWFATQSVDDFLDKCLDLSGVGSVFMTNSPFDEMEMRGWNRQFTRDGRFTAGLRLDPLLLDWERTGPSLKEAGYDVASDLGGKSFEEVGRFLRFWTDRMNPAYCMVSLPPDFQFPDESLRGRLLAGAVLPHCRERNLPLGLMMGVKRAVNPELRLAGDGVGRSDLSALETLCARHPQNKFLATVLSGENQQELCVLARKFRNLHVFGCWWFNNTPAQVEEMTRLRLELIGMSCTPQHSDARVLDQLVYKWRHSKQVISKVLADKYEALAQTGWVVPDEQIRRDTEMLYGGAFKEFRELRLV